MELYGINFCECGCCEEITRKGNTKYKYGHNKNRLENIEDVLCLCGCEQITKKGNKYINGHNKNGYTGKGHKHREIIIKYCECGCGKECKQRFVSGHNGRGGHANKGKFGELNGFYGKHHTEESRLKMCEKRALQIITDEAKLKISKSNTGKVRSEESKKNYSEAFKGKPKSPEHAAKCRIANLGKIRSEESKRKQSESLKGRNNPNWKGGITSEYFKIKTSVEYNEWRLGIYKRDQFLCHRCNNGGKLNAHHIINFSKLLKENQFLWDINNGITFCKDCHDKFHKKYGRKNNNQQQIFEFVYENH